MTYIRGIWLFSNGTRSGSLEVVMSKRFSSVEKRLEKLLEEDFVGIPNDKDILEWFESRIIFENVDKFTAAKLQDTFTEASLGVFSIDNLSVSVGSDRKLDKEKLASISETNLLHFMRVGEERYLWPFMHSYSGGSYMLMLLSLETSISEDHSLLTVYRSRSRSTSKDVDNLAVGLVEVRVGVQLLEDLMELVGGGQDGEVPEAVLQDTGGFNQGRREAVSSGKLLPRLGGQFAQGATADPGYGRGSESERGVHPDDTEWHLQEPSGFRRYAKSGDRKAFIQDKKLGGQILAELLHQVLSDRGDLLLCKESPNFYPN
ncbi:hypothetical protein OJ253_3411 [Cryptosporidium canis]|uniref:Uncharacterized protein n=1 Tax=Cryptosporidium canis TaxID=195482 RepID=A0A9D5DEI3_9CRYT|nr:hypothetical protein OJ253_3411 [Cryptosporidium canis]